MRSAATRWSGCTQNISWISCGFEKAAMQLVNRSRLSMPSSSRAQAQHETTAPAKLSGNYVNTHTKLRIPSKIIHWPCDDSKKRHVCFMQMDMCFLKMSEMIVFYVYHGIIQTTDIVKGKGPNSRNRTAPICWNSKSQRFRNIRRFEDHSHGIIDFEWSVSLMRYKQILHHANIHIADHARCSYWCPQLLRSVVLQGLCGNSLPSSRAKRVVKFHNEDYIRLQSSQFWIILSIHMKGSFAGRWRNVSTCVFLKKIRFRTDQTKLASKMSPRTKYPLE